MRAGKMPFQMNENLHKAAKAALGQDPDFADGYRIIEARFHREGDGNAGRCVWFARVITRACRYAITFNSRDGISQKAVLG